MIGCAAGAGTTAASPPTGEGILAGQYSCDENLSPASRSKAAFSVPIELTVREERVSGMRENAQTVDAFSGSVDSAGNLTVALTGSWKDDPSRRWLGRFNGLIRDGAVRASGEMLAPDGRTKLRECALVLTFTPFASPPRSSTLTVPVAPAPGPTRAFAQLPLPPSHKGTLRPKGISPTSEDEHLPPKVVQRLEVFRRSLDAIGQDPARSNDRLAEDASDAYDSGNFGNAFENNCRPLDGPYRLEQLGRIVLKRPFQWTPDMASRVEPLWGQFIAACPGYGQLGESFLAAVRRATEERARQIAALRTSHSEKKAESEAAQTREAEQKRAARQQQEDVSQRSRADRQRQDAEVRQQRLQDLKSGKLKPASLADAEMLHDARRALTLIFSPKVGPSSEMFTVSGILRNVIGDTLIFDVGGRLAEVRLGQGTVFLGSKFAELRLNGQIGMVGTYGGMDQNRGETWAVFKAAYVQQ